MVDLDKVLVGFVDGNDLVQRLSLKQRAFPLILCIANLLRKHFYRLSLIPKPEQLFADTTSPAKTITDVRAFFVKKSGSSKSDDAAVDVETVDVPGDEGSYDLGVAAKETGRVVTFGRGGSGRFRSIGADGLPS
ncbi:hypothetical protein TWF191_002618 [Orbilia oligospora]|uniref:Uncharacterized protein n=1 Tax=Orbilia oligospora TaxID=2813651 RepID=A0A7C8QAC2_ORBOL|nr:hypothetical protein TWF191_002618 [Orbilia oligospora]